MVLARLQNLSLPLCGKSFALIFSFCAAVELFLQHNGAQTVRAAAHIHLPASSLEVLCRKQVPVKVATINTASRLGLLWVRVSFWRTEMLFCSSGLCSPTSLRVLTSDP